MAHTTGDNLTFTPAGEEYGIGVRDHHKLIALIPIRFVPGAPAFIQSLVNP